VPASIYFNVIISGVLTGLVYGLMALGLSVIFGVVRVVNFAHGEMMAIAMYLAIVLFNTLGVDPLVLVIPLAGVLFVLGYALQAGIINPFISRPEYSQFILLVAIAIIITNVLLIIFGPDARSVQTSYSFDSFAIGPVIVDATKVYAAVGTILIAGSMMVLLIDVTPALGPAYTLLAFIIVITGGLGSMPGALLGGVLIGLTEALAGLFFTPSAKSMFSFGLLVLVLLLRPQGLLARKT
jgi:branched-chain amino acid transport system permease protein